MNIVKTVRPDGNDTITIHFRTPEGWKSETMLMIDWSYALANPTTVHAQKEPHDSSAPTVTS